MSRGVGWDLWRKKFAPIDTRVTNLEETYVRTCWFEEIASGTSGTLTLPSGGSVVLNQWEGGLDALTSTVDTNWPTFETPVDSGNAYITTTLDASGNWSLSGTPSSYPIAIVYIYRVKLINFNDTYAMFEVEPESELVKDLTPELGGDLGCGGYNIDNVGKICFGAYSTKFYNNTGVTLTKGIAVTICGLSEEICCVCKTDNREIAKMPACGIVYADVTDGNEGCVVRIGRIQMDTSGMTGAIGDRLYVQGDGSLDTVVPTSGMVQRCGFLVKKASGNAGRICVCLRGPRSMYSAKDQFPIIRMGDTGYEKVSVRDYTNNEILSITPTNLDMNTHKIIGVVDPTSNQEAATKKYVDDNAGGNADPFFRSQFTYHNADQITCGAAQYQCKDKYCYWVTTITTEVTGAAGGADWWYLYLDYSAITSGVVITASKLIWSVTEPIFNTTYRQWMNGDDCCIYAVRTDGSSNILEFFHENDCVQFADGLIVTNAATPSSTWTDSTQIIPKFTRKALVIFRSDYVDKNRFLYWRTNGQTGTTGHFISFINSVSAVLMNSSPVITDSTGKIEFRYNSTTTNVVYIYTDGWHFSRGI